MSGPRRTVLARVGSSGDGGVDGAESSSGAHAGAQAAVDVNDRVQELLGHVAALHRELAATIETLARERHVRLAVSPVSRHITSVPEPHVQADPVPQLLTLRDLAKMLQVDEKTVRRWRSEGLLPEPLEVAGTVRWHAAAIDAWARGGAR